MRANIDSNKKEIKAIGDKIDKDLNKSLLKASKPNTVNIRDIFSSVPKSKNQRVNDLNEELKKVRTANKRIKVEIQKIHEGFSDPLSVLNQDRGTEFKNKIKNTEFEIKTIEN